MRIAAYLQQFDSDEDDGGDHSEFAEEEHEVSDGVDGYDSQCVAAQHRVSSVG